MGDMTTMLTCQHCGGTMRRKTLREAPAVGCVGGIVGAIVLGVGIYLWGWWGVLAALGAMVLVEITGTKRRRVWTCRSCQSVIERA